MEINEEKNLESTNEKSHNIEETQPPLSYTSTEYKYIQNIDAAKILFADYNIPYNVYTQGEHKGELRVLKQRSRDFDAHLSFINSLDKSLSWINEHSLLLRDAEGNTVMMYSPYESDEHIMELDGKIINAYKIAVRNESIYGLGTKTIIVRDMNPDREHKSGY